MKLGDKVQEYWRPNIYSALLANEVYRPAAGAGDGDIE
jgi:hypothetical protein